MFFRIVLYICNSISFIKMECNYESYHINILMQTYATVEISYDAYKHAYNHFLKKKTYKKWKKTLHIQLFPFTYVHYNKYWHQYAQPFRPSFFVVLIKNQYPTPFHSSAFSLHPLDRKTLHAHEIDNKYKIPSSTPNNNNNPRKQPLAFHPRKRNYAGWNYFLPPIKNQYPPSHLDC